MARVSGLTRSFDLSISLKAVSQSNGELKVDPEQASTELTVEAKAERVATRNCESADRPFSTV